MSRRIYCETIVVTEVTLMDANYTYDEMLGEPQRISLHSLPYDKVDHTLKFNEVSNVSQNEF